MSDDISQVARACEFASRKQNQSADDRAHFAGTAAILRARAAGIKDPEQLRAIARRAREEFSHA
jgi:hypothetical protein